MQPITLTRGVRCRASREEVWAHISDTLRLNRAIHCSTLAVTPRETTDLNRYELRGRVGGFTVSYLEHPFSWSAGEFFSFYRVFLSGPAHTLATRYDLADVVDGPGCDVTVRIDITPRMALFRPAVWFATRQSIGKLVEFIATADQARVSVVSSVDTSALEAAVGRLGKKQPLDLVARLAELLRSGDDLDVAPIRPFALANVWSADRFALLRLCLEAVPAGLLELRWGLLCPSCRTTAQQLPSLKDLEGRAHCHACDLRYDTDLDRAVEAQFFPHPSIRVTDARPFCVAGPALTPHVLAQLPLEANATGTLRAPANPGRLRAFVRGGATASVEVVPGAPERVDVTIEPADVTPAQLSVAPLGTLRVTNRSGEGRHIKLERTGILADAATAHHVATMPEFRPLFGSEALRPGLALKVAHVAVLFSDLCGSTALYSRVGDAAAFGLVTDCFTYGTAIVERHGGTLVKTMGDALMAAFTDSRAAVAAGAEMLEGWAAFAKEHAGASAVDLKIGIHAGPCTVVTANNTIDYFGQTVNRAARVQHLAGSGEAVVAEALASTLPAGTKLEVVERFEATVKGIAEPLQLARLRVRDRVA